MKKFKFQLEKLLSYKNQILESEMQVLAKINADIHTTEQTIKKLNSERDNVRAEYARKLEEATTPLTCQMYQNYLDKLRDAIKARHAELALLREKLDKQ